MLDLNSLPRFNQFFALLILDYFSVEMGCINSTRATIVRQLTKTDAGSKHDDREDSAVSKGTTDSGVVVENRDIPMIPGEIPEKLPPLSSEGFTTSNTEEVQKETDAPVVLQQDEPVKERQKSSEILEELISQGIIPVGQRREEHSWAAYSITMEDERDVTRRPPAARLKSLKIKKAQTFHSKEEIDQKMRLAEQRRKSNEETLRTRLRSMSARVRAPRSNPSSDEDSFLTPVQPLQAPELLPAPEQFSQVLPGSPQRGESAEKTVGDDKLEWRMQVTATSSEEEEVTQVEEIEAGKPFSSLSEPEVDSSSQQATDKEDMF